MFIHPWYNLPVISQNLTDICLVLLLNNYYSLPELQGDGEIDFPVSQIKMLQIIKIAYGVFSTETVIKLNVLTVSSACEEVKFLVYF